MNSKSKTSCAEVPTISQDDILWSYESIRELHRVPVSKKTQVIKAGISKDQLIRLKEIFELDYDTLSSLLMVTNRTLHDKKEGEIFGRNVSDRIVAIADVFSLGYNVFNSRDGFHQWLRRPNRALGGLLPLSLLDTIAGMEEVKQQLMRAENHS